MGGTTGAAISVATGENIGFYNVQSHIPFPNTPVVRGIGVKWPETAHGYELA